MYTSPYLVKYRDNFTLISPSLDEEVKQMCNQDVVQIVMSATVLILG